jgi:F-type H+-transporting ATPase subunit delta
MKNVRVARRYAQALMPIAEEQRAIDTVASDFTAIGETIRASRDLRLLLLSPVIKEGKKAAVFQELFAARVNRITLGFVLLLIRKRRELLLPDIIEQFHALRDEKQGIVTVNVTGSTELSAAQERDLGQRMERYSGKKVRIRFAVDSTIRGGLIVRLGDTVLDMSVRRQLEQLRERFLQGGPSTTTNA